MYNPSNEDGKKINGKVIFKESGTDLIATGSIQGLPMDGVIDPMDEIGTKGSNDVLLSQMITLLENAIYLKTKIEIKLFAVASKK